MQVDIGGPVPGWVDCLHLPGEAADWPPIGRSGIFEVVQHRESEVRLFPLDAGMRGLLTRQKRWTGPEWAAITEAHPVGSVIEATVERVFPSNRELSVRFEHGWAAVEYDGVPPQPGSTVSLTVERQSEWTQSLILSLD
ncbi:hypothetical protein [Paractinoplanes durhamensis]|uniref:hypothetical protein n=1 Tax=Paractinoplanes durhamensis TaxID=113563 RepID=UPI001945372B|nr:hypothetical protein [Actinoplanes durhamensis]